MNLNNNIEYKYIKNNLIEKFNKIGGNSIKKSLVLKTEKFNKEINSRGFMLFTSSFLGIMFLMGSGAVLYFKTFTSLEDDKNRSNQLVKIGLTYKEISSDIIKEIGTIFLVPPVLAIVFTGYYLSKMFTVKGNGS
ncbi:hypothetical protein [Clostridium akagii]|uniref:hypothetical protein n=1 Tax=Clostridium akagii TaxID=91623 RepID=UPI00055B50E4|nr:hypothetical protein [Clostridium akagii]